MPCVLLSITSIAAPNYYADSLTATHSSVLYIVNCVPFGRVTRSVNCFMALLILLLGAWPVVILVELVAYAACHAV